MVAMPFFIHWPHERIRLNDSIVWDAEPKAKALTVSGFGVVKMVIIDASLVLVWMVAVMVAFTSDILFVQRDVQLES
jgi:hypothetical protein